jgi:hypothetical protein
VHIVEGSLLPTQRTCKKKRTRAGGRSLHIHTRRAVQYSTSSRTVRHAPYSTHRIAQRTAHRIVQDTFSRTAQLTHRTIHYTWNHTAHIEPYITHGTIHYTSNHTAHIEPYITHRTIHYSPHRIAQRTAHRIVQDTFSRTAQLTHRTIHYTWNHTLHIESNSTAHIVSHSAPHIVSYSIRPDRARVSIGPRAESLVCFSIQLATSVWYVAGYIACNALSCAASPSPGLSAVPARRVLYVSLQHAVCERERTTDALSCAASPSPRSPRGESCMFHDNTLCV